jgi:hypothetical protein
MSGPPLPETPSTLSMSFATDDDRLTITDSYRLTTVPLLFRAVTLRKHMPVVSSIFANDAVAMPVIENATIERKSMRITAYYR